MVALSHLPTFLGVGQKYCLWAIGATYWIWSCHIVEAVVSTSYEKKAPPHMEQLQKEHCTWHLSLSLPFLHDWAAQTSNVCLRFFCVSIGTLIYPLPCCLHWFARWPFLSHKSCCLPLLVNAFSAWAVLTICLLLLCVSIATLIHPPLLHCLHWLANKMAFSEAKSH